MGSPTERQICPELPPTAEEGRKRKGRNDTHGLDAVPTATDCVPELPDGSAVEHARLRLAYEKTGHGRGEQTRRHLFGTGQFTR